MGKSNEYKHTCACGADIRTTEVEGGLFIHQIKIGIHLRGQPHYMAEPKFIRETKSGNKIYTDVYGRAQVLIENDN